MHGSLGIMFESTRQASYTGFEFVDPDGVKAERGVLHLCNQQGPRRGVVHFGRQANLLRLLPRSHPTSSTNSGTPLRRGTQFGRRRP
jgi:hypothetical protein